MRLEPRMRQGPPLFVCDAERDPRCQGQYKKKGPLRPRGYRHDHCRDPRCNVPIAGEIFDVVIALPTLSSGVIRRASPAYEYGVTCSAADRIADLCGFSWSHRCVDCDRAPCW